MFSYEDRLRAVQLYIKLGKRVRATIRHHMQAWHLMQRANQACWLVAYPSQGHEMQFDAHRPTVAPHRRGDTKVGTGLPRQTLGPLNSISEPSLQEGMNKIYLLKSPYLTNTSH